MSDRISRGKENDYTPVNQYIDEQSRLRRARSFWLNARSWALILVAVGLLAVLLAWAYSLIKKHYILNQITNVQERVIEDETRKALNSKQFSKTPEAMDNIRKGVDGEAERQDLVKKLKKEKLDNAKLAKEKLELEDQIKFEKENTLSAQKQLKENLSKEYEDKIGALQSEKLDLLNEQKQLREKLKNNPGDTALQKKFEENKKKGKTQGNLRLFEAEYINVNGNQITVKTRFHFPDPTKKPTKIECYIYFGIPSLSDLEMGTEKDNFTVPEAHLTAGYTKKDFLKAKKENCKWNYFN